MLKVSLTAGLVVDHKLSTSKSTGFSSTNFSTQAQYNYTDYKFQQAAADKNIYIFLL